MRSAAALALALAATPLAAAAMVPAPGTQAWIASRVYVRVEPGGAPALFSHLDGKGRVEWQGVSLSNWFRVEAFGPADALASDLQGQEWAVHASPYAAWVLEPQVNHPDDPRYLSDSIWRLNAVAGNPDGALVDIDMDAPEAWDILTDASSVIVMVHDNSMNENHADLGAGAGLGNFWQNAGEIGGVGGVDDDGNGCVDDFHGCFAPGHNGAGSHGTPVGGVIAAIGNNGVGVTGVAWTASLAHYTYSCGTGSICGAVEAVDYAETIGARVFNASYGSGAGSNWCTGWEALLQDYSGLYVAASGNSGTDNDTSHFCPSDARNANVLSVGGVRSNGGPVYNYGAVSVDVHGFTAHCADSTSHSGGYGNFSGTSCAAPQTAGLATMRMALCPFDSVIQVKQAIMDTVVTSADDPRISLDGRSVTGGAINLHRLLSAPCYSPSPTCPRDPLS